MARFSLAQLEAFVWICRLGTFRAAAERLNLTQPSVSLRIRELEQALGASLFERRGNSMRLSAEGSILARYAERGLELFDEMEVRLRSGDPLHGSLRLGASDIFAMTCLSDIVSTLEAAYPLLQIELTVTNSTELGELLTRKKTRSGATHRPAPASQYCRGAARAYRRGMDIQRKETA
jgi:DNA-binding transcriptional LysR family regulator